MRLKGFGCSFIFGTELSDDGRHGDYATGSRLTWPAHLANHLGYDYECCARPGSGNLQIAERVLNHVTNIEASMYVIGWTWIDRFDYLGATNDKWLGTNWSTIMPIDETDLARTYYRDLHSEYRDKLTTLMSVKLVIDKLKQKNLPFIMTYMDDLMFDNRWNTSAAVNDLQDHVRPYMTRFDDMNFLEWSKKNNYPIGTAAHPLEQAHTAAGDYMIKVFDTKNKVDRWHLS